MDYSPNKNATSQRYGIFFLKEYSEDLLKKIKIISHN